MKKLTKKKFNFVKLITYLFCGLLLLGGFGVYNFYKYEHNEYQKKAAITENVAIINSTVEDISTEQNTLRRVQRIYQPAPAGPVSGEYAELQARIERLEAEKKALEVEKKEVVGEIKNMFDIFKFNTGNPFINIVLLPFFAYFIKKVLDFLFARLEDKVRDHSEEGHVCD